ncbi:origin recognition complex subunit 3-like [Oscarella lobularis]|uniref:origin recognition complex subunit 3-like n=1 Tax=Oscarella lobularis TaxID=121494 RepID=UPI003313228F
MRALTSPRMSLVSGITVHVPKRKPKSQRHVAFKRLDDESEKWAKSRRDAYDQCTSKIEEIFQSASASTYQDIFDGITSFITSSQERTDSVDLGQIKVRGLPTAVVLGGVCHTDNDSLFGKLGGYLKKNVGCYRAFLNAEDCPNMKSLMKKFVSQLIRADDDDDDDDDDDEQVKEVKLCRNQYNMSQVVKWYKLADGSNPIIIILKDLESFLPSLIQDFIEICNHYCDCLPLVLVLGLSTGGAGLQKMLSQSIISMLYIKEFNKSNTAMLSLDKIIENLLIHPRFPFQLGHHPFQYLIERYIYHAFSLQSLHRGIKFAALEHFSKMSLSLFCNAKVLNDRRHRESLVQGLSKSQLESIKSLESFQRYVGELPSPDRKTLLSNEKHLKDCIVELVGNLQRARENFYVSLKCLLCILKELPSTRLGTDLHDVCLACSSGSLPQHSGYKSLIRMLKQTSEVGLIKMLNLCLAELDALECVSASERKDLIVSLLKEIETVKDVPVIATRARETRSMATETTIQRKMRLQERLKQAAAREKEPKSRLDKIRVMASRFFDEWFSVSLQGSSSRPLHETVCYDSENIAIRLNPPIRSSLHVALTQPESYLKKRKRTLRGSSPSPDVCLAYSLYLECGKLINLHDWLQAFASVVESDGRAKRSLPRRRRGRKRTADGQPLETITQARFIRAISELQFMGFIKPTKRKTDHVQRLIWNTS